MQNDPILAALYGQRKLRRQDVGKTHVYDWHHGELRVLRWRRAERWPLWHRLDEIQELIFRHKQALKQSPP